MKKVIVYSTPVCPYCVTIKNFLKDNEIEFEEKDVSADKEALERILESGAKGVPVVEIDGEFIIGFDREKLIELLEIEE